MEGEVSEIFIERQQDAILGDGASEDIWILAARSVGANLGHVLAIGAQGVNDVERTVLVGEKLHDLASCNLEGVHLFFAKHVAGIRPAREQVLTL